MGDYDTSMNAEVHTPIEDSGLFKMRLDVDAVLQKIEVYITGQKVEYVESGEMITKQHINIGEPKANRKGITSIMNWISCTLNNQVVAGNFPVDKTGYSLTYEQYIADFREYFMDYLILNRYKFELDPLEIEGIVDVSCNIVIPFMSRLIGNEERKSYNRIDHRETNKEMMTKRGLQWFARA